MIYSEVIIVGAGPAGSTCAWKLKQKGVKAIILDKKEFPREKLCAGWITPQDIKLLELKNYPHGIITFNNMYIHFFGIKRKVKALQYSIRRCEFDNWLLKRSETEVYIHNVQSIKKQGNYYIIDNKYKCKYLVGAGGTFCPVYKTFFEKVNPRSKKLLITAMDQEFAYDYKEKNCLLWFFENKLNGYFWYVPKKGYINIGLGGFFDKNKNIQTQWNYFIKKLESQGLIKNYKYKPRGYIYYARNKIKKPRIDNAFILGDSAGLATLDLAEGVGPAAQSGILAANSIAERKEYSLESINKNSLCFIDSTLINLGTKINRII